MKLLKCYEDRIKDKEFVESFNSLAKDIHNTADKNGFWDDDKKIDNILENEFKDEVIQMKNGLIISLMHSELTEVLEAFRNGNPQDDKCPEFKNSTIELADCIIRIIDFAEARGLRLGEAIIAKNKFNKSRPYKHGKEF